MSDIGPGDVLVVIRNPDWGCLGVGQCVIVDEVFRYRRPSNGGACTGCGQSGERSAVGVQQCDCVYYCPCTFRKKGKGEEVERKLFKTKGKELKHA